MKAGIKNLKRAAEEKYISIEEGHYIMQVLSLRGSNIIEVIDAGGNKSLSTFPAKFRKSMWIKRGSFVIIGERVSSTAIESGYKVTCKVSQVLFHEQVRLLQKSPEWPDKFKTTTSDNGHPQKVIPECAEKLNTSDDDDLPAIEANMNRIRPFELFSDSESESDSDPIS